MAAWPSRLASTVRAIVAAGSGQVDWNAAEAETDAVVAGLDLGDGHLADRGRALGVEHDELAGEAVLGPDGGVVKEPARCPSGASGRSLGGAVPDGGEAAGGEVAGAGPAEQDLSTGGVYPPAGVTGIRVLRRDRLGGLIHEYAQAHEVAPFSALTGSRRDESPPGFAE